MAAYRTTKRIRNQEDIRLANACADSHVSSTALHLTYKWRVWHGQPFMTALRRLLLRLWNVVRSAAAERELDREMAAHLALLEEELQRRGLTAGEARAAARRSFGRLDRIRDTHREVRSLMWIEDFGRVLQYAKRTLLNSPGFTLAAVLTLGIAVGGATAVFSLLDAVLLRPLPFPSADRL